MQFEIFKFESVGSTNDVAINLIKEKKKRNRLHLCGYTNKGQGNQEKRMGF